VPTRKPNIYRLKFGQSFKRYRDQFDLSQQNIHALCKAARINLYNSQLSHLEQGKLELKSEGYTMIRDFNKIIDSGKFPPTVSKTGGFTVELRDKFRKAEPYLDADDKPILFAYQFFALIVGEAEINKKYKFEGIKIDKSVANNVSAFDRTVFQGFAIEELLDRKEAWKTLSSHLAKDLNQKQQKRMKEVITGFSDWTVDELNFFTNNGTCTTCVVMDALASWTGKKMPPLYDVWTKGAKITWEEISR
tara:strand:- start:1725 stop:2468 length:744 start_codon:yes stop_codon:yes gene_type:complete